jgi:hypothetical protein
MGSQPDNERRGASLIAAVLFAGITILLSVHVEFAWYALSGYHWTRVLGTVVSHDRTSAPAVEFTAVDGSVHSFTENYVQLCGGRSSFCFIRDFQPGQVITVVYDPWNPSRAFVHDYALFTNVITWFVEAGIALLVGWILVSGLSGKALRLLSDGIGVKRKVGVKPKRK